MKSTGYSIERQTQHWIRERPDTEPDDIAQIVTNSYAMELVSKILNVLDTFIQREGWVDDLDKILSPRNLTFASLGFSSVDKYIEAQINERNHHFTEFGRPDSISVSLDIEVIETAGSDRSCAYSDNATATHPARPHAEPSSRQPGDARGRRRVRRRSGGRKSRSAILSFGISRTASGTRLGRRLRRQ